MLMVLAFIVVFGLGCAAILVVPGLVQRWRDLERVEHPVTVAPDAHEGKGSANGQKGKNGHKGKKSSRPSPVSARPTSQRLPGLDSAPLADGDPREPVAHRATSSG
jgi:hypothetical protein